MRSTLLFLSGALILPAQLQPRVEPILIDPSDTDKNIIQERDIDGDGDLDLLFLFPGSFGFTLPNTNSFFLEQLPDGSYSNLQVFAFGDRDSFTVAHDLNGDGVLDPLQMTRDFNVVIMITQGQPVLRSFPSIDGNRPLTPTQEVRFDILRVLLIDGPDQPYLLYLLPEEGDSPDRRIELRDARPGPQFDELIASAQIPDSFVPSPFSVRWGQFDGVGELDLVLSDGGEFVIWPRDQDFGTPSIHSLAVEEYDFEVDDLNLDGVDDLWSYDSAIVTYALGDASSVGFNEGQQDLTSSGIRASEHFLGLGQEVAGVTPSEFLFHRFDNATGSNGSLVSVTFETGIVREQTGNLSLFGPRAEPGNLLDVPKNYLIVDGSEENPGITVTGRFLATLSNFDNNISQIVWSATNDTLVASRLTSFPSFNQRQFEFATTDIADFNGDGIDDFLHGPDFEYNYWLQLNTRDQVGELTSFSLLPQRFLQERPELVPSHVFPGDVDGDGDVDLVISYLDLEETTVADQQAICLTALNQGDATFVLPSALPPSFSAGFLSRGCSILDLVDWDNDGDLDLIDGTIGWRENLGNGEFSTQSVFLVPAGAPTTDAFGIPTSIASSLLFADFDNNGTLDLFSSLVRSEPGEPLNDNIGFLNVGASFGRIFLTNSERQIVEQIEIPTNLATTDNLGNPFVLTQIQAFDFNEDDLPELLIPRAGIGFFGDPVIVADFFFEQNQGAPDLFPNLASGQALTIPLIPTQLGDFDGDGEEELVSANQFVSASPFGPVYSAQFDFLGPEIALEPTSPILDADGDGDSDFIYQSAGARFFENNLTRFLVRNQIVDETSDLTFAIRELGVLGADANPNSDPDGDGSDNFHELILGSDPSVPNLMDTSILTPSIASGPRVTYVQNLVAVGAGVQYQLEESFDAQSWEPVNSVFVRNIDTEWAEWELDTTHINPTCFYRLVVTM